MGERTMHLRENDGPETHIGQILDYLYVPQRGDAPEEALITVLDIPADHVRVGPDTNEVTLAMAREGRRMAGLFVTLVAAEDPKQVGRVTLLDVADLDAESVGKLGELVSTGYCIAPPPDVEEAFKEAAQRGLGVPQPH